MAQLRSDLRRVEITGVKSYFGHKRKSSSCAVLLGISIDGTLKIGIKSGEDRTCN